MRTDEDAFNRMNHLDSINNQIFDLVYYGKFSFEDCESMTSLELKWFHNKLVEVKTSEIEAKEKAIKSAQQARDSSNK